MRLDLDFSVRQRPLVVASARLAGALLAAGAVALVGVATAIRQEAERLDAVLHEHHLASRRATSSAQPTRAADREEARHRAVYESVRHLMNSGPERVLRALESERDDDVALLALAIDVAKGEAILTGEARRFAAAAAFRDRLSARSPLASATINSHQAVDGAAPAPVRFEMRLTWGRE